MSDIEILQQKNPSLASLVERWRSKYNKSYDLSSTKDQADFYEGVLPMGLSNKKMAAFLIYRQT